MVVCTSFVQAAYNVLCYECLFMLGWSADNRGEGRSGAGYIGGDERVGEVDGEGIYNTRMWVCVQRTWVCMGGMGTRWEGWLRCFGPVHIGK